ACAAFANPLQSCFATQSLPRTTESPTQVPTPPAMADAADARASESPTSIFRRFHTPRRASARPSAVFLLRFVSSLPGTYSAPPGLAPRYRAARARFFAARRPEAALSGWRASEAVPPVRASRRFAIPVLPCAREPLRSASRPTPAAAPRSCATIHPFANVRSDRQPAAPAYRTTAGHARRADEVCASELKSCRGGGPSGTLAASFVRRVCRRGG